MALLDMALYFVAAFFIYLGCLFYDTVSLQHLQNPYEWYELVRGIFTFAVCACVCCQLINATACRPIEILFNLWHHLMFLIQLLGFFLCLLLAFFLGAKHATIRPHHRLSSHALR